MKIQISRDSHAPEKQYSAVLQQQGRMITDADWNELQAIIGERLAAALRDVAGSGVAPADPDTQRIYAGGFAGTVAGTGTGAEPDFVAAYAYQAADVSRAFPGAPQPPLTADDVLYADIWERTVLHLEDARVRDPGLHGADTCARSQQMVQIKRASPSSRFTNFAKKSPPQGTALLTVALVSSKADPGIEDPCEAEVNIAEAVENFLFRVEVNDVEGDADLPTAVTVKWSLENAAEAYRTDDMPEDFWKADPPYVYDFYSLTTEKQIGVHLVTGFTPARSQCEKGFPSSIPKEDGTNPFPYVRRWDGLAEVTLDKTDDGTNWQVKAWHRGATPTSARIVKSSTEPKVWSLVLSFDTLTLTLDLTTKDGNRHALIAGDYWLATARTSDPAGATLLGKAPPVGIEHRYVQLGAFNGSNFVQTAPNIPSLSSLSSLRSDLDKLQKELDDHINDPDAAHAASAISAIHDGYLGSVDNVQAQLTTLTGVVKSSIDLRGPEGASKVGDFGLVAHGPKTVVPGTVAEQLQALLDIINVHVDKATGDHDGRYALLGHNHEGVYLRQYYRSKVLILDPSEQATLNDAPRHAISFADVRCAPDDDRFNYTVHGGLAEQIEVKATLDITGRLGDVTIKNNSGVRLQVLLTLFTDL